MSAAYDDLIWARRSEAVSRARAVIEELAQTGVTVRVIGSLVKGQFGQHSDVDFLVIDIPDARRYAIEWIVEDIMGDIPFDVVYLDEVPDWKRGKFTDMTADASQLR